MRVLITNTDLDHRGGLQVMVRTLARALERQGHSVMAYGSDLTERPRLAQNDVVPLATDLENLALLPDIIHAQHHLDGMTALTALPTVPAIFHCHGATWRGTLFKHPRLYRYLAMSRTLASRMAIESNLPLSDIDVLLNSVEVASFPTVRTLPAKPERVLVYNNRHRRDSPTVSAVETAVERLGLTIDFMGFDFGTKTDAPEQLLPRYDIVFASGLSALEALICGCAVVILGRTSTGPLVRPDNFDDLRQVNFSIATNSPPPTADYIEAELGRYAAPACASVSARARREGDVGVAVAQLIGIYEDVIARHRATTPNPLAESLATSRYLRELVPLVKMTDNFMGRYFSSDKRSTSIDDLSARVALLEQQSKKLP